MLRIIIIMIITMFIITMFIIIIIIIIIITTMFIIMFTMVNDYYYVYVYVCMYVCVLYVCVLLYDTFGEFPLRLPRFAPKPEATKEGFCCYVNVITASGYTSGSAIGHGFGARIK